ncbi:MAG: hypothetical protein Satyrvirus11_2 [Satyrvirus sp.]|uniref:Uncharacterized protein n=1 Tax=Satyrvirus sp. TaxID=2487771 RepID=A0A3G5ADR6_9VIRU|nr:MAG: hypothetical protein Satyrvirus11_2 [Satyrvirus sp.]
MYEIDARLPSLINCSYMNNYNESILDTKNIEKKKY